MSVRCIIDDPDQNFIEALEAAQHGVGHKTIKAKKL